jgi:hypothetical protein
MMKQKKNIKEKKELVEKQEIKAILITIETPGYVLFF